MATFQHMDGSSVMSPLTAVVGRSLHLKVIPASKEPVPTVSVNPASIARITHFDIRKMANFIVFKLEAVSAGGAVLQATGPAPGILLAGPIDVVVENSISLPAASSGVGLLVRLFWPKLRLPMKRHTPAIRRRQL